MSCAANRGAAHAGIDRAGENTLGQHRIVNREVIGGKRLERHALGPGHRALERRHLEPFEILRRVYSYDRTPLVARTESTEELKEWRRERVSFAAAYLGERILANILNPKNTPPPYQAVIWFPGSYALQMQHSDRDLPLSFYFDFLPRVAAPSSIRYTRARTSAQTPSELRIGSGMSSRASGLRFSWPAG
jgi:hypothetical protein